MIKSAIHKFISVALVPLVLAASITWVAEKHECLTDCHNQQVAQLEKSCCTQQASTVNHKSDLRASCCETDQLCIDKGCCVNENLVVDKTIDEVENIERQRGQSIFNFLFAPLTQSIEKTVDLPDSVKNRKSKKVVKPQKGQVSHYILFQNFRC